MPTPIGRPEPTEAIPFQHAYIRQVEGDDILAILHAQRAEAQAFFARASEAASREPYAPGKWTLRQTLGHITDTERIVTFRALWLARGLAAPLPGFDQDEAVAVADANTLPWAAHLDDFDRVRCATLSLFENLPAAAWLRTGLVSDHPVTVRALAFVTAGHLAHHLNILKALS